MRSTILRGRIYNGRFYVTFMQSVMIHCIMWKEKCLIVMAKLDAALNYV